MIQHAETLILLVLAVAVFGPIAYFAYQSVFVHKSLLDGRPKRQWSRETPLPTPKAISKAWRIVDRLRTERPDGTALLAIDEFFNGNTDPASLAPNLHGLRRAPSFKVIQSTLKTLESTPGVTEVRIEVQPDGERDQWPFSDTVLVFTTLPTEHIARIAKRIRPDEVTLISESAPGSSTVRLWWD
jgi:hypothetical protein